MDNISTDALVIGGGPGGYAAAIRMAQHGIDTTLIEMEKVGGTCLNVGCIPSKALLHASGELKKVTDDYSKMGINVKSPSIDWKKTQEWKDGIVNKTVGGVEFLLKANKVRVIKGKGRFVTGNNVKVDDHTMVSAQRILIATGSKILELPTFPFKEDRIINSTDLLALKSIPKSMVILGGGVIGMELGNVYAALGCKITIIEMLPAILPSFEKGAVTLIEKKMKSLGAEIINSARATGYKAGKKDIVVEYEKDGKQEKVTAEYLAVAVGRVPNSDDMGLESIGIKTERGKINVDEHFKTELPNVYAIGDMIDGAMLAHKATAEGLAVANMFGGHKISRNDIKIIPEVVYTKPEIAKAGLSEEEAKEKGYEIAVGKFPFTALGRASTTNESDGFIKYIADKASGRILGVLAVSPKASELISEAALAIEMGATLEDVALTVHPHPTFGESHMEAAEAALNKAIHVVNKK